MRPFAINPPVSGAAERGQILLRRVTQDLRMGAHTPRSEGESLEMIHDSFLNDSVLNEAGGGSLADPSDSLIADTRQCLRSVRYTGRSYFNPLTDLGIWEFRASHSQRNQYIRSPSVSDPEGMVFNCGIRGARKDHTATRSLQGLSIFRGSYETLKASSL
jgi:hypothetical protein